MAEEYLKTGIISFSGGNLYSSGSSIPLSNKEVRITPLTPDEQVRFQSIQAFAQQITKSGQLRNLIQTNTKDKLPFEPSLNGDHKLLGLGISSTFGNRVYLDSLYAFELIDTNQIGVPLVVVGFDILSDAILIRQIQGVKGNVEKIKSFGRWEKSLVEIVEMLARDFNLKKVHIITAESNGWISIRIGEGDLDRNKMRLRYDGTAKRNGYKWDPDNQVWTKNL